MTTVTEGAAAPDFQLQGAGGPVKLADYVGRPLVIYFYPKDDTTGCTKEAQEFTALAGEFAKAGVALLGVSKDSVASHAKFTAKYDLAVPLGSDPEGAMIETYGSWVEKSMYGKKYMGMERTSFLVGADGKIKAIWRKVKPEAHAAQVIEAAAAL